MINNKLHLQILYTKTNTKTYLMSHKSIQALLLTGIIGAIIVGIGEYMLHFIPGGPEGEISMLFSVPLERAAIGHFIAVAGIPLYFIGYFGLMQFFSKTNESLSIALLAGGVISFTIGGIWVASRYFAAEVFQHSAGTPDFDFYLASYEDHVQVLVWVLRISIALVSVLYIILVLTNKNGMPKWLAIFNPIVLLGIIISTVFWIKPIGIHIAPIAMNATHFIFFGIILLQLKKQPINQ